MAYMCYIATRRKVVCSWWLRTLDTSPHLSFETMPPRKLFALQCDAFDSRQASRARGVALSRRGFARRPGGHETVVCRVERQPRLASLEAGAFDFSSLGRSPRGQVR